MSPLVALLVLACASPLLATRVRRQNLECADKHAGYVTNYAIPLSQVYVNPGDRDGEVDVVDNCALMNMKTVGENVHACDCQMPPTIVAPSTRPFSPILIHRNSDLTCYATVDITQYCA